VAILAVNLCDGVQFLQILSVGICSKAENGYTPALFAFILHVRFIVLLYS